MLIPAGLRWVLLAVVFTLLTITVITHVEAAIEITVIPPGQEATIIAEPVDNVPQPLKQKKLRTRSISGASTPVAGITNLKVNGYRNNIFVHGELKTMPDGLIEGYLYSGSKLTYVYGELRRKEKIIQAYDARGRLYLLEIIKK
ncbi:hypothetical protein MNBD_GAMMA16-163 [hydrothermal vent metagenome]|uniref:Uncharacterized protein n=1 Tax=hydrothermal vent metagenome TaxID=652676 RepID=A0A3B0ZDL1_9ZZZZ